MLWETGGYKGGKIVDEGHEKPQFNVGDRAKMVVRLKNLEKNYNYKEEWTPI